MKKRRLFCSWEGWVGLVALIIGAGVLAFSIWYLTDTAYRDGGFVRTEATVIVDGDSEIIEYVVNGQRYHVPNTDERVGSHITVAYNPEKPEECFFPSSNYTVSIIITLLGCCFLTVGTLLMVREIKERKMEKIVASIPEAQFITSAAKKEQFIVTDKPVIAVCGKSNVGKSSFINMVTNRKKLAKVSKEPGRTRLINYFDCGAYVLADLPGYGFARVSKQEKLRWARLLDDFFADKEKIAHVFALADIRHDPTDDDKQMIEYLYFHTIPFTVIATKADKLSKAAQTRSINSIAATYKCGSGNIIATSALNRQGLIKVLDKIKSVTSATGYNP